MCLEMTNRYPIVRNPLDDLKLWNSQLQKNEIIVAFKKYTLFNDTLSCAYVQEKPIIEKDGTIRSNRLSTELTSEEEQYFKIQQGIHVYLHSPTYWVQNLFEFCEIFTVTAEAKDLVGSNGREAVFLKIKLCASDRMRFTGNHAERGNNGTV